jgi:endonuclease/exonuclease/phosphatase family metal-dependent hydrolase
MKKILQMKQLFACMMALFVTTCLQAQDYLNVMTFNIRYNNPGDSANAWPNRKDFVASQILFHESHIVGVQEALNDQMQDLQARLAQYKYVGVGRDGGEKGEYSAIFYDTTRLQLLQTKTFWLSEQPEVVASKGWDAALTRIVTWAQFKDRKTKKVFYHFNTHFDHRGPEARRQSAHLLLKQVAAIAGKTVTIITGDFNAKPTDEPIKVLKNTSDPLHFINSFDISKTPHYGPICTFNAFRNKDAGTDPIDYIFLKNGGTVLQHATLTQTMGGLFSSDHFPVFARIKL